MAVASIATDEAAALLNDAAKVSFTFAVLLPFLQRAHRDLQLKLDARQSSVQKEVTAVFTITAGLTAIPALSIPADLLRPIKLQEAAVGTAIGSYTDMHEGVWEANIKPGTTIGIWTWREEAIVFPAATADRSLMLYYVKGLTVPTVVGSQLGFTRAETFLSAKTAHYAAKYILQDEKRAADLDSDAEKALKDYFDAEVRGQQGLPARRRPYGSRWARTGRYS
jgi:hypothetical protein